MISFRHRDPVDLMRSSNVRAAKLAQRHYFECDCISCASNSPPFKVTGKQRLDVLSCSLLAILDGIPEKDITKSMPVTREELRTFEKAAINFLHENDHLHPSMETLKIQLLLTQIWFFLMR